MNPYFKTVVSKPLTFYVPTAVADHFCGETLTLSRPMWHQVHKLRTQFARLPRRRLESAFLAIPTLGYGVYRLSIRMPPSEHAACKRLITSLRVHHQLRQKHLITFLYAALQIRLASKAA